MNRGSTRIWLLTAMLGLGAAATPPPTQTLTVSDLARAAETAMQAGDHARALDLYTQLGKALPESATVPYNMGVAAYRAGDLERAAELFRQTLASTSDPKLQSRTAYNLGTTVTSAFGQQQLSPENAGQQLDHAEEKLGEALQAFRQALDVAPDDSDAKANAELTWRRLKQLEELREMMEQQQQQSGGEESEQQQDQPQEQPESQDGEQASQSSPQQTPGEEGDQQEQQQQADAENQDESADDQDEAKASGQDGSENQEDREETEASAEGEKRQSISREEAERLLQSVRDKERQRRQELARREQARQPPVEKDW